MPNTHRRRDADATQLDSWVASASAVCIEFATSSRVTTTADDCRRKFGNWTCWEFILSSWVVSAVCTRPSAVVTQFTLFCSLYVTGAENWKLGHDWRLVRSHRRHDELSCVGVGGVYWALGFTGVEAAHTETAIVRVPLTWRWTAVRSLKYSSIPTRSNSFRLLRRRPSQGSWILMRQDWSVLPGQYNRYYHRWVMHNTMGRLSMQGYVNNRPNACVGWQVTLRDPIRQATPCSSEMDSH